MQFALTIHSGQPIVEPNPVRFGSQVINSFEEIPISAERRVKDRYPLGLSVRFKSLARCAIFSGVGRAMNLSSKGVFVALHHIVPELKVPLGARVEMSIAWPSPLHGTIPIQLRVVGRVVRWGPSSFAATFGRHEFRTVNISSLPHVIAWPPSKFEVL
jgi:hypothetical protein